MNNAISYTASLSDIADVLDRDGAPAFERLDIVQRRDIVEALHNHNDPDDAIETLAEIAGEALEALAESLAESLEKIEEQAQDYLESQDYLDNYTDCIKSELMNKETHEKLEELLEEELTPDEYEHLSDEIATGLHDGIAPGCPSPGENTGHHDRVGPFGVAYDIWARHDALITLGPGGDEQAFPVDDKTERKIGELLDLFNRLDEIAETPRRDFFELFSTTVVDGSKHGLDSFAVMVQEPEQILFYVDLESLAESLAEYRKDREEEQTERLEAIHSAEIDARKNWPSNWLEFLAGYRQALAWSSNDTYKGEELESLEAFEFSEQALEKTAADCLEFIRQGAYSLEDIVLAPGYSWSRAGHDFWMTRAGHGVGFWDRQELEHMTHAVDYLCKLCEEFGNQDPYIAGSDSLELIFID